MNRVLKRKLKGLLALWMVVVMAVALVPSLGVSEAKAATTVAVDFYLGEEPLRITKYYVAGSLASMQLQIELDTALNTQSVIMDELEDATLVGWRLFGATANNGCEVCYEKFYMPDGSISASDWGEIKKDIGGNDYSYVILEPVYLSAYMYTGSDDIEDRITSAGYCQPSVGDCYLLDPEKTIIEQTESMGVRAGANGYALTDWKLWWGGNNSGYIQLDNNNYKTLIDGLGVAGTDGKITVEDFKKGNSDDISEAFGQNWTGNILEPIYGLKYRFATDGQPSASNNFTAKTEEADDSSATGWKPVTGTKYEWYSHKESAYKVVAPVASGIAVASEELTIPVAGLIDCTYDEATDTWKPDAGCDVMRLLIPVQRGDKVTVTPSANVTNVGYYILNSSMSIPITSGNTASVTVEHEDAAYVLFNIEGSDDTFSASVKIERISDTLLTGQDSATLNTDGLALGQYFCKVTFPDSWLMSTPSTYIKPTEAEFKYTEPSPLTYDGTKKEATVTVADGVTGVGEITKHYYDADGNEVLDGSIPSAPTNVGTYTVKIDVAAGTTYAAANGITKADWKFTVVNAEQNAPAVTAKDETISGKNDGGITGLTTDMEYSEAENGTYTKVTDADAVFAPGTYYVRYAAKANYNASPATAVEVKAGRKLVVTYVADSTTVKTVKLDYNASVADSDIPTAPAKEGYTVAWDKEAKNITEDTTVTAVYTVIQEDSTGGSTGAGSPPSGDGNNFILWMMLMLVCGTALVTGAVAKQKK